MVEPGKPTGTARLELTILPVRLAICRLAPGEPIPAWALGGELCSITRTPEELSVVCDEGHPPAGTEAQRGFRALRVEGPLPLEAVGILSSLTAPLAAQGISVFALSTHDTDYLLVREGLLARAVRVLGGFCTVHGGPGG